jgi:ubiquinone/menaquinone biosynthesis C-methylase UbiE
MGQTDTYDPYFFEQLKKAEEKYFWFQIRRKWIFDKLKIFIPPPAKVLEVGCGTGNVSSFLAKKGYEVTGCEFYTDAIKRAWPGFMIVQGDANNLPFEDNQFDIVGLFDVIEHFQDDITPLKEALRVVRKGGILAVTVPAREELWSWIDEISLHKRRYTKEKLKLAFSKARLKPLLIDYIFMTLYPIMKCTRSNKTDKGDDLFRINKLVNILLGKLFDTERHISKIVTLPLGTSLIGIARKEISF